MCVQRSNERELKRIKFFEREIECSLEETIKERGKEERIRGGTLGCVSQPLQGKCSRTSFSLNMNLTTILSNEIKRVSFNANIRVMHFFKRNFYFY